MSKPEPYWWVLAPSGLLKNRYCPLDGVAIDIPPDLKREMLEVAIFNGRDHRRVCDRCLGEHAARLRGIASTANGIYRPNRRSIGEMLDSIHRESQGFTIEIHPDYEQEELEVVDEVEIDVEELDDELQDWAAES